MNKYHARPATVDGIRFASQREAARYGELRLLARAGAISDLQCHPVWPLLVNGVRIGRYTADFSYTDAATGAMVVEDSKGVPTRDYLLRKKLMAALYGIVVVEV